MVKSNKQDDWRINGLVGETRVQLCINKDGLDRAKQIYARMLVDMLLKEDEEGGRQTNGEK